MLPVVRRPLVIRRRPQRSGKRQSHIGHATDWKGAHLNRWPRSARYSLRLSRRSVWQTKPEVTRARRKVNRQPFAEAKGAAVWLVRKHAPSLRFPLPATDRVGLARLPAVP